MYFGIFQLACVKMHCSPKPPIHAIKTLTAKNFSCLCTECNVETSGRCWCDQLTFPVIKRPLVIDPL